MGLLQHDAQGLTQGINPCVHQLTVGYGPPRLSAPWNTAHPGTAGTQMKLQSVILNKTADTERQTPLVLTTREPRTPDPVEGGTRMRVGLVKDI